MATGIKDKVAIIGMGCTRFGERWDVGAEELVAFAIMGSAYAARISKNPRPKVALLAGARARGKPLENVSRPSG